jgi:outer membrane protein OmpA-like peptidoglycan-associated protein
MTHRVFVLSQWVSPQHQIPPRARPLPVAPLSSSERLYWRYVFWMVLALALSMGSAFADEAESHPESDTPGMCETVQKFPITAQATAQSPVRVDLLWVIDDSSSMERHQRELKESIQSLFDGLDSRGVVDYQMAITTTSGKIVTHGGRTPLIVRSHDSNGAKKHFKDQLLVGTRGSPKETGSQAALDFFMHHDAFIRSGSNVIVVVLTDEDDSSASVVGARAEALKQAVRASGGSIHAFVFGGRDRTRNYQENLKCWSPDLLSLRDSFDSNLKLIEAEAAKALNQRFRLAHEPDTVKSAVISWGAGKVQVLREGYEVAIEDQEATISLENLSEGLAQAGKEGAEFQISYTYACKVEMTKTLRAEVRRINKILAQIEFIGSTNVFVSARAARIALSQVRDFLNQHPGLKIQVVGATSTSINPVGWLLSIGNVQNDDHHQYYGRGVVGSLKLSRVRAAKIKSSLVELGVDPNRISSRGSWSGFGRHWYSYALDAATAPYYAIYLYVPYGIMLDLVFGGGGIPVMVAGALKADRRVFIRVR